jgi:hypothetical protein
LLEARTNITPVKARFGVVPNVGQDHLSLSAPHLTHVTSFAMRDRSVAPHHRLSRRLAVSWGVPMQIGLI